MPNSDFRISDGNIRPYGWKRGERGDMSVDRTPRGDGPTTYRMQSMYMPTPNYTPPGQEPPKGCRTPAGPLLGVAVLVAAFLIWGSLLKSRAHV